MIKLIKFLLVVALAIFLEGCASNVKLSLDEIKIDMPDVWFTKIPYNERYTGQWWEQFEDENLEKFILEFQNNSPDLKSIINNKKIAYQSSKMSSAGVFPFLNANIRVDTSVQNLTGFGEAGSVLLGGEKGDVVSFENKTAGLGFNFQWELDIWGRVLNGKKAAQKNYEASNYDLSYLGFSSIIRATQLYFQAIEAYGQLKIAEESYQSLVEIRDVVKDRYEKGLRSSLDYRLAETSVLTSKVSIETRNLQLRNLNRRLEVLIGKYPRGEFKINKSLPINIPDINNSIPADLITRRPDIRSLFLKVESEGLLLAQAKRNLFPGITLNGSVGTSAQKLEDVFNDDYGIWNVGLALTAPIFNGNRLKSAAKLQESVRDKSMNDLFKGLLNAFSEVEQLLELDKSLIVQQNSIDLAVKQSLDAYNLSKERYDKGVTLLESVLNNQRQYNNIKSQYLSLSRQRIDNRLSLLLALGGDSN